MSLPLEHLGFAARMAGAGHEARLQRFNDGTVALFLPDPDGFMVELSFIHKARRQWTDAP